MIETRMPFFRFKYFVFKFLIGGFSIIEAGQYPPIQELRSADDAPILIVPVELTGREADTISRLAIMFLMSGGRLYSLKFLEYDYLYEVREVYSASPKGLYFRYATIALRDLAPEEKAELNQVLLMAGPKSSRRIHLFDFHEIFEKNRRINNFTIYDSIANPTSEEVHRLSMEERYGQRFAAHALPVILSAGVTFVLSPGITRIQMVSMALSLLASTLGTQLILKKSNLSLRQRSLIRLGSGLAVGVGGHFCLEVLKRMGSLPPGW